MKRWSPFVFFLGVSYTPTRWVFFSYFPSRIRYQCVAVGCRLVNPLDHGPVLSSPFPPYEYCNFLSSAAVAFRELSFPISCPSPLISSCGGSPPQEVLFPCSSFFLCMA